jgi:hypothetical protein
MNLRQLSTVNELQAGRLWNRQRIRCFLPQGSDTFGAHPSSHPLAYPVGGFGGSTPPPPKLFRSFDKAEPNSQFRGK